MLKTAYEMRISDCSSDVCSSDLLQAVDGVPIGCSAERFPDREERACDDGFVGRGLGRGGFDCSVPHCLEQRHVHHVFPRLALDDACETVMGRRWRYNIRSEEHTSELPSLMRSSSAVFCSKQKN